MAIGSRIEWIEHKGKPILVNDLTGLTDKEIAEQMIKYEKVVLDMKETHIHVLSDITNATFGPSSMSELKRIVISTKSYVSKYAIVGVIGIKSILFNAVKQFAKKNLNSFNTIEEAKDWLIK